MEGKRIESLKGVGMRYMRAACLGLLAVCFATSYAHAQFPPPGDPSEFTGPVFGDLPDGLPEANEGSFEGGDTGTAEDAGATNVLQPEDQRDDGTFNVPSNGPPSPLFGAAKFTQKMLRFEEFGPQALEECVRGGKGKNKSNCEEDLPTPKKADGAPKGSDLESFLAQDIYPFPTKFTNDQDENPWKGKIEDYVGRALDTPPAEGRPPGLGWSHQRWEEFTPEVYFQTAQAGARTNGGFRDEKQLHGYSAGEFAPGGLYHNTTGNAGSEGTTDGIAVKFHPNMPVQDHTALWTFDGTFPPKLLNIRYGEPTLMRHYNALPIDVAANRGFGTHTITTHEHNGHSPAESDGFTNAFYFPGQFYDYRWALPLAGHDSINTNASDPKAGRPDGNGGITNIPGDWRETMSTHWFHDHMLDFTAQNVYKGNAAMMNYYSSIDRGNEGINDGVNLRLPSGTALDWGNRDYDVNVLVAEKAWDSDGQLWFNPFNIKGFIGDVMTVNWLYDPYLEVAARQYRFRILNGSVSRYFKIALVNEAGDPVPFHMIANDGNIMEHSVLFQNGELPTQGIAERYDIIVDFSQFNDGDKLYFVNMLQHKRSQVTDTVIPLAEIDDYESSLAVVDGQWNADPVVGKFLEFRVKSYAGTDLSMNPADFVEGGQTMIPLRQPTPSELNTALHRTFAFEQQPTDEKPWVIETDLGAGFGMDPRRLSAAPTKNSGGLEVWRILNSGSWSHPVHIHFEEGIILRRNGVPPPEWEKWARKDVYRIGPQPDSGVMVEIALRFREFAGTFMEHCHNTQHEDHAMLLRWDIEHQGQVELMPSPIPTWDGVTYVDTVALPTAREGDGMGQVGPNLDSKAVQIWIDGVEVEKLDLVNMEIGDAANPTEDERAVIKLPLTVGTNVSCTDPGEHYPDCTTEKETEVFFVLHDISDEELAEEMGIAWAGGLVGTPVAATSPAAFDGENWTFFGDLPNPIAFMGPAAGRAALNAAIPQCADVFSNTSQCPGITTTAQSTLNTYTPLRAVNIQDKDVLVNAFFVQWGDEFWERLRIDENCDIPQDFPDDPPNTSCRYNGDNWGVDSAHALEIMLTGANPFVRMKGHKSWVGDIQGGDYLPYYIVVDSFPAGPPNNMGVPYVAKHAFLGPTAVPLVQFVPNEPLSGGFPPTAVNSFNLRGGGPLGGQIGLPTYFMPEDDYTPFWHIGFINWLVDPFGEPDGPVVKGIERLKALRALGKLEIREWPAVAGAGPNPGLTDDYDFENPASPHVVNCPTPVTIDFVTHGVNKLVKAIQP